MLNSCFRLCCFFLFSITSYAWGQPLTPLSKIEVPFNQDTEVFSFTDNDGVTLLFRENGEARLYLLNHDLSVRSSYIVRDLPQNQDLKELGFTNNEDGLSMYYWNEETDTYHSVYIQKDNGNVSPGSFQVGRTRKGNLYWGSFTYNGMLHILRMPRNSQMIRICRFEGGEEFSAEEYKVSKRDFLEKTEDRLSRVETHPNLGLRDTYLPGKLYQYGEMVYLSLDENDSTFVVRINLGKGSKSEAAFPGPGFNPGEEQEIEIKSNSMIINQHLFQVSANKDSLFLQVRNMENGKILKNYRYGTNEMIDIRQGEMEYIDDSGKSYLIKNTEELLVQIADANYMAVCAIPDETYSTVSLTVGAVQVSSVVGVSGIVLAEKVKTAHFRTLLDTYRFEPYPGPLAEVSDRFAQLPGKTHWTYQGKSFWGYYDAKNKAYLIGN